MSAQKKKIKALNGHPRFYELLNEAAVLHANKNSNYAKDNDPLSNLRASEEFGYPSHIGTLIRMTDKWSRIKELAKGKEDMVGESMKDSLMDLAIYSLLTIILLEEDEKITPSLKTSK